MKLEWNSDKLYSNTILSGSHLSFLPSLFRFSKDFHLNITEFCLNFCLNFFLIKGNFFFFFLDHCSQKSKKGLNLYYNERKSLLISGHLVSTVSMYTYIYFNLAINLCWRIASALSRHISVKKHNVVYIRQSKRIPWIIDFCQLANLAIFG